MQYKGVFIMKRTIIAWGLAFVLVLSTMVSPVASPVSFAEEVKELVETNFHYTIMEGKAGKTARINSYSGPEEKLTVPDTLGGVPVTEILFNGSQNQNKIKEIVLPRSMAASEWLYSSLSYLSKLSSITVAADNPALAAKDGVLFTKDFSVLAVYPKAKTAVSYTEPATVKKSYGFRNNPFLKEITFSSNREYTTTSACGYSSIEKAVIPANVTKISESAFEYCTNLKTIQWGGNEKEIGRRAFFNCTALTDVSLPDSVTKLEADVFLHCKALKTVKLPKGLTFIGNGAFASAVSIKKITIPDSVLYIGYGAFKNCKALISKAPYLKKIAHTYDNGEITYTYRAKAKVTKKGKAKNYAAADITKIKAAKKTINIKKGKKSTLKTNVYIKGKKKGTLDSSILTYKSGKKSVVKVTKKGVVKGIKKGKAIIRVKLRTTGKSYKILVRVK